MGRLVAIDYGQKRIGIAITDPKQRVALPHKTLLASRQLLDTAKLLVKELTSLSPIDKIIIGLPLEMSGREGFMAEEVKKFSKLLESLCSIPLVFWDERLSSKQAERALQGLDYNRKKRASLSDSTAACLILQSFLELNKPPTRLL